MRIAKKEFHEESSRDHPVSCGNLPFRRRGSNHVRCAHLTYAAPIRVALAVFALGTFGFGKEIKVKATIVDDELTKGASQWTDVVSKEYFVPIPKGHLDAGESHQIRFTLPKAGDGQVPFMAVMHALQLQKQDPLSDTWTAVEDSDIGITFEIPGSIGPATYKQPVSSKEWQKGHFQLPVGPGDDIAEGAWHLILQNLTANQVKYGPCCIRLWLRKD